MSTIDYKALAERLSRLADELAAFGHHTSEQRVDDLRTVVSLLEGMAGQEPVYAYEWDTYDGAVRRSFSPAPYNGREPTRTLMLYLHPAPQPQPTEDTEADLVRIRDVMRKYGWQSRDCCEEILALFQPQPTEARIKAAKGG